MRVYLAGPVSYLSYTEALGWRKRVQRRLKEYGIECALPLVREKALKNLEKLDPMGHPDVHGCDGATVFHTDVDLLYGCDVILANLLGAERISLGTVWELGWAYAKGLACLVVMEKGNPHEHLFLYHGATVVRTLKGAVDMLRYWKDTED